MKYIDSEKLIAEIERRIDNWSIRGKNSPVGQGKDTCESRVTELSDLLSFITSLQQEQPDFDDVDPNHLVHSHYTKVRETKTGRVFWAEYSSEAAEWYEAGTGKAYSISDVEIVKEQPEVDLENEIKNYLATECAGDDEPSVSEIARHFYELGLNTRKEETK